jgi:hypothetical protein
MYRQLKQDIEEASKGDSEYLFLRAVNEMINLERYMDMRISKMFKDDSAKKSKQGGE